MSEWNCMFNHELLVDYASGNNDQKDRSVVERHLAKCYQCRREVTELEQAWWALDTWSMESQRPELRLNDLRLRIASLDEPPTPVWTRMRHFISHQWDAFRPAPRFAVAAMLGVMVMLPTLHLLAPTQGGQPTQQAVAVDNQTVSTVTASLPPSQNQEKDKRFQQAVDASRETPSSLGYSIRMNEPPVPRGGLAPSSNFVTNRDVERNIQPMASATRVGYEPAW
jgi:hypothetical protein